MTEQKRSTGLLSILMIMCAVFVAFAFTADSSFGASSFNKKKVKAVKANVVANKTVRVSWARKAGSDGYVVYYSQKKRGTYRKGCTSGAKATSGKVSRLIYGKTYYFKVRAYKKKGNKRVYNKYSKIVKYKVGPAPSKVNAVAVEPTTGKIRISFKKSRRAAGYEVWRATKKSGKYKKIATLKASKLSYVDKGLKANKWYYYKVRPFDKNKLKGGYSEVASEITGGNSSAFDLKKVKYKGGPLKGKKILFLGSSVTYGYSSGGVSFVDFIAKKDGVVKEKNAVSGTTISTAKSNSYVHRLKKVKPDGSRKLIVCQLSSNDARFKVPVRLQTGKEESLSAPESEEISLEPSDGQNGESSEGIGTPADGGNDPSNGGDTPADGGDTPGSGEDPSGGEGEDPVTPAVDDLAELDKHTNTVRGAIDYIIVYSRQKLNCDVVFYVIPPFNTTGKFDAGFYSEMRKVLYESVNFWKGNGYNPYILDMQDTKKYPAFKNFKKYNENRAFYMKDSVHPTRAGYYKKYLPAFESFLTKEVRW